MTAPSPVLLLHENGELDDIAGLLRALGIRFQEHRGVAVGGVLQLPRDLLVATARRAITLPPPPRNASGRSGPARVALAESDSPGLRAGLREAGFEILIRRPVHPTALRLLLLRLLYRGPERRTEERVAVGAATRYRMGLFWKDAILTDLSVGGCRLLTKRSLGVGRQLTLEVPDPSPSARPTRVQARVLRAGGSSSDSAVSVALEFLALDGATSETLERLVSAYTTGPAFLPGGWDLDEPLPKGLQIDNGPPEPEAAPATEPETAAESEGEESQPSGAERRVSPRTPYGVRVVTLGEEAAHVVMGRDLSLGGIRIERHGGLEQGQRVALALHGAALPVPVVVKGHVLRDDGEAGLVILFDALSQAQQGALQKLISELGGIESLGPDGETSSSVVTQVIDGSPTDSPS